MQINKELHGAQEFAKSLDIELMVRKFWLFWGFLGAVLGSFNENQQRTHWCPRICQIFGYQTQGKKGLAFGGLFLGSFG